MPYLLNLVYVLLILAALALAALVGHPQGQVSRGLRGQVLRPRAAARSGKPCVWLHAVSVGEVNLLAPLLREIAQRRPDWQCVVSTTTMTGMALARKKYAGLSGLLLPAGFQLGRPGGHAADSARRARAGRVGVVAQSGACGPAERRPGGGRQRPAERAQLPRLPADPPVGRPAAAKDRPAGGAGRRPTPSGSWPWAHGPKRCT